ncbi:MAG: S41 family peptidase [Pirellulales bacterium]
MPARNIQILMVAAFICIGCYLQAKRYKYAARISSAIETIERNYVKPVTGEQLYESAMKGMLELDPYSEFIPPPEYVEFQAALDQQFGGLGILIEGPPNTKKLTVVTPLPKTPAYEAGIQPGDVITHINGKPTASFTSEQAREHMRGAVGTPVELTIERIGGLEPIDMKIVRADIQVDSVVGDHLNRDSSWNFFLAEEPRVAYVRVSLFGERTTEEFRAALRKIRPDARALVIDLRFNPGGLMNAAVAMCDMLLEEGRIVSTKGRRSAFDSEVDADSRTELSTDIPIVVMTNDQSASAAEIMAACLQDRKRAYVAGERSFGKGTVQQVFELQNDRTAIKITIARYLRPNGKNIHRSPEMSADDEWGVSPDPGYALKMTEVEQVYLFRRWQQKGDPRRLFGDQPPQPECSGDSQLRLVLQELRKQLDK